jgi:hypothetical protein
MLLQTEVTLGLYYLVLHRVTLVTSVTFVTHVTSVTSVTCSIRKFHQSKYISTGDLSSLIFLGEMVSKNELKKIIFHLMLLAF